MWHGRLYPRNEGGPGVYNYAQFNSSSNFNFTSSLSEDIPLFGKERKGGGVHRSEIRLNCSYMGFVAIGHFFAAQIM